MAIENYSFGNIPRPGERLLSGIKSGVGIQDLSNRRAIALAAQQKQQALNDSIANLNEIENPTAADYTKVTSLLPKEQADSLRANWELRSKEYQSNLLQSAGQTLAAFTAKPEVAMNLLRERAESERNSGNEADADFLDKLVSVAEIDPKLAKQTLGIMISSMPGGAKVIDSIRRAQGPRAGEGQDPVQSSKILDDGTVQIVRKSGAVEVKTLAEQKKEVIKQAQIFSAKLQGLRSGERKAGEVAIKLGMEAFNKLAPIKKNIKNLTEGIRLIDEGAQTGVIAKRFPSIKTASIALENLQGRLGLDIIADVTFGALSESELAFAKDTALPIGLEGEPLKDWLSRKRDAQRALAESLEEAALFLGTPGNTVPDYIRFKRAQQQPRTQPAETQTAQALPQGVTEEDIAVTMEANQMTRQQVLDRLGGR